MLNVFKNKLLAIDITIPNQNLGDPFLVLDLTFSLDNNESIYLFFNNEEEKEAFKKIFKKQIKFFGFFNIENDILDSKSNMSDYFSMYNENDFSSINDSKRIIEVIEEKVLKSINTDYIKGINNNKTLSKSNKLLKIFHSKKIEFSYLKTTNDIVIKSIEESEKNLKDFKKLLSLQNIKKNDLISLINKFMNDHIRYVYDRMNLVVNKNISFIDLYLNEYDNSNTIKKNKELFSKTKEIINKIYKYESYDKSLTYFKKEILKFVSKNNFEKDDNLFKNLFEFNKKFFENLLNKLNMKLSFYKNNLKNCNKKSNEYKTNKIKILVCTYFISFIKQNFDKFKYLSKEEMINFWWDLNNEYNTVIIREIKQIYKNKKNIRPILENYLQSFLNKYINLSNITKTNLDISNELNTNTKNNKQKKIDMDIYYVNQLKIDCQDLLDELNWEIKLSSHEISKNIEEINKKIFVEYEQCRNNVDLYWNNIKSFLELNFEINKKINISKWTQDEVKNSSNDYLRKEIDKYNLIFNFLLKDEEKISKLFLKRNPYNSISLSYELFLISRYKIFKFCQKISLNILDLFKRYAKTDKLTKKIVMLLIAFFDTKKVSIFENFFSDLNDLDINKFSLIYNEITKQSNKNWILIEDNLKSIEKIKSKVSIIDDSRQIEYGNLNEIIRNPIYDITFKSFNLDTNKHHPTPKSINSIENFDLKCDYYKINENHFIFGNVENIYEWTKKVPEWTKNTISVDDLNDFKNKLSFKIIENKNNQTIKKRKKNDKFSKFKTKEYLIIDVEN